MLITPEPSYLARLYPTMTTNRQILLLPSTLEKRGHTPTSKLQWVLGLKAHSEHGERFPWLVLSPDHFRTEYHFHICHVDKAAPDEWKVASIYKKHVEAVSALPYGVYRWVVEQDEVDCLAAMMAWEARAHVEQKTNPQGTTEERADVERHTSAEFEIYC